MAGVDSKAGSSTRRVYPPVYLVGAGPGDAGLITQAGAQALGRAAVVLYDALANPALLDYCPVDAEKIFVGKSTAQHTFSQDEINALLVEKARQLAGNPNLADRLVVRLKGGDPFVFGRGGEEGQFLRQAGVDFAVIPGVTAGIAGLAYAGIPVTHRDVAATVTFITGHLATASAPPNDIAISSAPVSRGDTTSSDPVPGTLHVPTPNLPNSHGTGAGYDTLRRDETVPATKLATASASPSTDVTTRESAAQAAPIRFEALAALGGTLVFYMGVKALPEITRKLRDAGMAPDTPVAVIQQATHLKQKTVVGTLVDVAGIAEKSGIQAPAITVVGAVVKLRRELNWFESRPLFGQTVLVTRTRPQASQLAAQLMALGGRVIEAPTIELAPVENYAAVDQALVRLHHYHCVVFTSAAGVQAAWQRLGRLHMDARAFPRRVAAVGPATAAALRDIGILPDLIPEEYVSEQLSAQLIKRLANKGDMRGRRFLLLRSAIASPILAQELMKAGAVVDDLAIYRTITPDSLPSDALETLRNQEVDWITFTSASTAKNLHALLPENMRAVVARCRRLSIGPITSEALRDLGWPPTVEAAEHSIQGMIEALIRQIPPDCAY